MCLCLFLSFVPLHISFSFLHYCFRFFYALGSLRSVWLEHESSIRKRWSGHCLAPLQSLIASVVVDSPFILGFISFCVVLELPESFIYSFFDWRFLFCFWTKNSINIFQDEANKIQNKLLRKHHNRLSGQI